MKSSSKYEQMTSASVEKLISRLAVPTIITMLVSAFYNMADTYFVGRINTSATAAVGVVFSVMTLLQAIGFFIGQGSGVNISQMLGSKNKKDAQELASTALVLAVAIGIILSFLGFFFSKNLAKALGATETILPYASGYLKYILLGSPFILGSFVINNQLRFQGSAVYSMVGMLTGSILNVALDPLFIFKMKMGVRGAAAATAISQMISFFILLFMSTRGENIQYSIKKVRPSKRYLYLICKNGLPSLSRQGIATVATIAVNFAAHPFGDWAIAGISVFNRVSFFVFAAVIGFGQGFQPVCGFNYGAKNYERVKKGFWFCSKVNTVFLIVAGIVSYAFAKEIVSLFRDDPQVIEVGVKALRYQCFAYPAFGFCSISNMFMQATGKSVKATILALSRQGIFYIPVLIAFAKLFGVNGIEMTQMIADLLTFAITIPLVFPELKKITAHSG